MAQDEQRQHRIWSEPKVGTTALPMTQTTTPKGAPKLGRDNQRTIVLQVNFNLVTPLMTAAEGDRGGEVTRGG